MAEGLKDMAGAQVPTAPVGSGEEELSRQFAMAMNAPEEGGPQVPAPPPKDPEAPYGRTQDGKPKRGPGGRPPKKDKTAAPRVQAAAQAAGPAPRDYATELAELTDGAWFLLTVAPATHAQAAILKAHQGNLVRALNLGAQNSAPIRTGVELLTGQGTWVAAMGMALVPFVLQSVALWSGRLPTDTVTALTQQTRADLAALAAQAETLMGQAA